MGIYLGKNVHEFKHLLVRQTCCIALLKYVYVERSKPISHTFKKKSFDLSQNNQEALQKWSYQMLIYTS